MNRFNLKPMQLALGILAVCWNPSVNAAPVTYTYTGNSFDTISDDSNISGAYTTNDFISISFTTEELLPDSGWYNARYDDSLTSWTFSDGRNTHTGGPLLNTYPTIRLRTDGAGNISTWVMIHSLSPGGSLPRETGWIESQGGYNLDYPYLDTVRDRVSTGECLALVSGPYGVGQCVRGHWDNANIIGNPGIWVKSAPSPVPVPAAAWLFGSALLGLGAIKRRKA